MKFVTLTLSVIVFFCTLFVMAQPAYTNVVAAAAKDATSQTTETTTSTEEPNHGSIPEIESSAPVFPETSTNTEESDASIEDPTADITDVESHVHHFVTQYVMPTCTDAGYRTTTCECGTEKTETEPALGHVYNHTKQNPSCTENGFTIHQCQRCGDTYQDDITTATGHAYSKWEVSIKATPTRQGRNVRMCTVCNHIQTQNTEFSFAGSNAVYIESANIHASFTSTDFTQSAVDKYDVIYSWVDYVNAPFLLGHKTGSLKTLYNTTVGDIIYVNLNGKLIRYKVVVSEYGVQNADKNNIIGQTTGASIWDNYDVETLHMYTCYGSNKNDRWMVLAIRIDA